MGTECSTGLQFSRETCRYLYLVFHAPWITIFVVLSPSDLHISKSNGHLKIKVNISGVNQ
jgi:hypothetical protein